HKLDRCASGRQLGSRNHRCKRIEDVVFGLLDHVAGQLTAPGFGHVSTELIHDGAHRLFGHLGPRFLCGADLYTWKRCSGNRVATEAAQTGWSGRRNVYGPTTPLPLKKWKKLKLPYV